MGGSWGGTKQERGGANGVCTHFKKGGEGDEGVLKGNKYHNGHTEVNQRQSAHKVAEGVAKKLEGDWQRGKDAGKILGGVKPQIVEETLQAKREGGDLITRPSLTDEVKDWVKGAKTRVYLIMGIGSEEKTLRKGGRSDEPS